MQFIHGLAGFLVVVFAAIWLLLLFDRVVMPLIVRSDAELIVPDLREMPVKKAEDICLELGVELVRERVRVDNIHQSGTVVDQFPIAGSTVKPNRRISVVLSVREQLIPCPDVMGRSPREAALIADSSGLAIDAESIKYKHSSTIPEGVVMTQSPPPMTGLIGGDSLSITVSLGLVPAQVISPVLLGRHQDEIDIMLKKQRLRLGKITRYPNKSVREGEILEQSPDPGTVMKPNDFVHVTIAVQPADNR